MLQKAKGPGKLSPQQLFCLRCAMEVLFAFCVMWNLLGQALVEFQPPGLSLPQECFMLSGSTFDDLKCMQYYSKVSKIFHVFGQLHFSHFVSMLGVSGQANQENDEEAPCAWFCGPRWVAPRANEMGKGGGENRGNNIYIPSLIAVWLWSNMVLPCFAGWRHCCCQCICHGQGRAMICSFF